MMAFLSCLAAQAVVYIGQGLVAIDLGLSGSEHIQVRAVEHKNGRHGSVCLDGF
jgi:hypothetical protein